MAGGLGSRLRPYTITIPKPLVPIGELPILEIIIRQLASEGIEHITLAVNHQADLIKSYFGDGSKWNLFIDYSLESKPLSTMGPLTLISDLPQDFLVLNGDILTDISFRKLGQKHLESNSLFTISSYKRNECVDYGVLEIDEHSRLSGFREKPTISYQVSMGLYVLSSKVLDVIPENTFYGFDDLMCELIERGQPANVVNHGGIWLDIGRPDDYSKAIDVFENNKALFLK